MASNANNVAVLGVDPGSGGGLGWAVMLERPEPFNGFKPVLVASGVIKTKAMDKDDRSELWKRLGVLLMTWLDNGGGTVSNLTPTVNVVAYERVHRHSGVHAAHMYGGQVAIMQHMARERRVPWTPVQVHSVKRFLNCRASGKAKQKAMVDAAHALGYTDVADHNEADAIGIALAGLDQWKNGVNIYGT